MALGSGPRMLYLLSDNDVETRFGTSAQSRRAEVYTVYPFSIDLTNCTESLRTESAVVWKTPTGSLMVTDFEGRPVIPVEDRERFWAMDTPAKVEYLFGLLADGTEDGPRASGGWVAERLAYLGLIPAEDMLFDVKSVLQGAGWGHPISELRRELQHMGVKV